MIEPGAPQRMVVGVGASAGGLGAIQGMLDTMPPDSGMTFVVIVHLSADHPSNLAALLQGHTSMPVLQVNQPVSLAPNHVYVIAPCRRACRCSPPISTKMRSRWRAKACTARRSPTTSRPSGCSASSRPSWGAFASAKRCASACSSPRIMSCATRRFPSST